MTAIPMAAVVDLGIIHVVVEGTAMEVSSAILAMSSPVFASMLASGMKEGAERRIELPGKCQVEFEAFLTFLHPVTGRAAKITEENVDFLLQWFDEYEVASLKEECQAFLLTLPCSVGRLLQARRFSLDRQYTRCLQAVGDDFERMEIEKVALEAPEVMVELVPLIKATIARVRREAVAEAQKEQRKRMQRVEREVASVPNRLFYDLPEQRIDLGSGETVQIDEYARDLVAASLMGILGGAPRGPLEPSLHPGARGARREGSGGWRCCSRRHMRHKDE